MAKQPTVDEEAFFRSGESFKVRRRKQRGAGNSGTRGLDRDPGSRLGRVAQLIVGPRVAEAQIDPCIADMQHEYFEALRKKDRWGARSALFRGSVAVLSHVLRNITGLKFRFQRSTISALDMPERFSASSLAVGQMAYDHAIRLRDDHVDHDHLLLALLDYPRTHAMMQRCGANVDAIQAAVIRRHPPPTDSAKVPEVMFSTSALGRAWEAHCEANLLRKYLVEPEHLLVGLVRDENRLTKAGRDLIAAGFVRPSRTADAMQ